MLEHLIVISVSSFVMRTLPRMIRPHAVSTDTYYHLGAAEHIRRNSFKLPERLREYLMDSPYDYPPLFHYILALFAKHKREKVERYISAIVDTLHVMAVYFFAYYFFKQIFPPKVYENYAFLTTLLFLSSPALLSISAGPRAYQATPRVLGEFFTGLSFMAGFLYHFGDNMLYHVEGSILWGVAAVAAASAALLTSKFSAQVIVFFSLVFALFLHSLFFLLLPVLAIVTAIGVTKGYYMKVLKGHLGHLYIFNKVTIKKYLHTRHKNRLKDIISLPKDIIFNYKRAYNTLFLNNTFLIVAIRNPQLALLIPIYMVLIPHFIVEEPRYFLAIWILASLVCFVLTSLKPLQFLGEGERYLEYSILPQMILFVAFVMPSPSKSMLIWVLLAYHLILYIVSVIIFIKIYKKNSKLEKYKEEVFAFLRQSAVGMRLLPIGMVYELAYKSGCGILFPSGNFAINYISEKEYDELYELYSIPSRELYKLLNRYNLNSLFVSKNAVADIERKYGIVYDLSGFDKIFENDLYVIYSVEMLNL